MASATQDPEVRDLIDRALKFAPDFRESIALELLGSVDETDDLAGTIARRSEEIASGKAVTLTRSETEQEVRESTRARVLAATR